MPESTRACLSLRRRRFTPRWVTPWLPPPPSQSPPSAASSVVRLQSFSERFSAQVDPTASRQSRLNHLLATFEEGEASASPPASPPLQAAPSSCSDKRKSWSRCTCCIDWYGWSARGDRELGGILRASVAHGSLALGISRDIGGGGYAAVRS